MELSKKGLAKSVQPFWSYEDIHKHTHRHTDKNPYYFVVLINISLVFWALLDIFVYKETIRCYYIFSLIGVDRWGDDKNLSKTKFSNVPQR